jgi:histidinol phosphatase-like enzyme (inositol monophosphatase family)
MNYERELALARRAAVMAGDNAVRIRAGGVVAEVKADLSPVTIADRENERLIRTAIDSEFPADGILGEEGACKSGTSGRRWIVDPIDGTRDFVRGNRFWCVLIALEEADESQVGVAHFPLLGETYWGVRGGGSFRDGERLRASGVESIEAAVISPNGLHLENAVPYLPVLTRLAQQAWSVRSYGGALDACMLAAGQMDVWFEPKVEPWDLAALKLIIEESGAAFFAMDGSRRIDRGNAIGCAPALQAQVRTLFGILPESAPEYLTTRQR